MRIRNVFGKAAVSFLCLLLGSIPPYAQNQVLGEVQFVSKTKVEKTSGVWIEGNMSAMSESLRRTRKFCFCPASMRFLCASQGTGISLRRWLWSRARPSWYT